MLIAVCDDDKNITNYIKIKLDSITNIKIETKLFHSLSEMNNFISTNKIPDAIFMDICVGNQNGIDALKELHHEIFNVPVVFITGYHEFCQDIFIGFTPMGLLTKPIDDEKLLYYINKMVHIFYNKKNIPITVSANGQKFTINHNDILFIESRERKVIYNTINGKFEEYLKLDKAIEKLKTGFLRCHKSFAVNLQHIKDFTKNKILLLTGEEIPISRSHYENVKKTILEYNAEKMGL